MTTKVVYQNNWFRVLNSGQWFFVKEENSDNGALVLCYVGNRLVLVKVPRRAHETTLLEAPRGYGDPGETAVAAAARELFEETGYRVSESDLQALGQVKPNSAILMTNVNVFRCVLPADSRPERQHAEQVAKGQEGFQEVDSVELIEPAQLTRLIATGQISCGLTLAALMLAASVPAKSE
ncbi:NUDIX hydrolase [Aliidiomarina haloalkalitolerans]|uniref:NUDIX hydrolase n=1 Tax=Aliidiomarina haloalkalitolerans TaxID=859059 RepID=UPI0013003067|nr:NUDIX domain-containing protein [Aliidiomarina haloalkalitolerans]